MSKNNWKFIIGSDIVVGVLSFLINHFYDLTFLFVTLLAMMVSGFAGLVFVFQKENREIGVSLLGNCLIIPFLFCFMAYIGRSTEKKDNDFRSYVYRYQTGRLTLELHGEHYYKTLIKISNDNVYHHQFEITMTNDACEYKRMKGYHEKISDNIYRLIVEPSNKSIMNIDGNEYLCKDTMILSNDTLYNFLDDPILLKRDH